jgi:hypothetical protein
MTKPIKKARTKKEISIGRPPLVLEKLTPEEIIGAGEKGYDGETFLIARGLTNPKLRKIAMEFPKWKDNYEIGAARFNLRLMDRMVAGIDEGDTQIIKQLATSRLGMGNLPKEEKPEVIIIGKKNA